jgi:hypothetical protein
MIGGESSSSNEEGSHATRGRDVAHPALALTVAPTLHLHVGPALPVQRVVGPGPLSKVGGGG